jgi:ferric-dicitrate binding protein FerR (iron transport regulator)
MNLIERLQRLDERLGLDGPRKRQKQEERRAALKSLPQPARRSLTRLRIAALLVLVAALVAVGLLAVFYTSMGEIAAVVLTFVGSFGGIYVGRWVERHVLEQHGHSEAVDH